MLDALCEYFLEKPGSCRDEMVFFVLDEFNVQVSQISISCLCYTANCFLGLTAGFQRSPYAGRCYARVELVQHEEHHLVPVQIRLLKQVFTQSV